MNRVGVLTPCGTGNMGNEMTMAAIVQNLRRLRPGIELRGFSANPDDTAARYDIPSWPMARARSNGAAARRSHLRAVARRAEASLREGAFLYRRQRALSRLDLLIVAGTGLLTDSWGGAGGFPYNVFAWAYLAHLSRIPVAFVSAGAGPIDAALSKRFIRGALRRATYRSFRDDYSKELIESLGVGNGNHVCPDLAFSLTLPDALLQKRGTEIAIIGLPYKKPGHWERADRKVYDRYVTVVASFARWLLENGQTVRLVPTHLRMDLTFIDDLKARLHGDASGMFQRLIVEPTGTFEQIVEHLSRAAIVVSSRFHGVVFSYLLGKPVLGISYHPKMDTLMKDFKQEEFCVALPTADGDDLRARFARLEETLPGVSGRIRNTVDAHRAMLARQYETLLRL